MTGPVLVTAGTGVPTSGLILSLPLRAWSVSWSGAGALGGGDTTHHDHRGHRGERAGAAEERDRPDQGDQRLGELELAGPGDAEGGQPRYQTTNPPNWETAAR